MITEGGNRTQNWPDSEELKQNPDLSLPGGGVSQAGQELSNPRGHKKN